VKGVRGFLSVAVGSAAAIAIAGAAPRAQAQTGNASSGGQTSGGPGGLGTEVPLDSQAARSYFSYSMPNDTAQAKRVQDGIQKLHADYQAIIEAASAVEANPGASADARKTAQQLKADAKLHDERLVNVAQRDERLDPSGPRYESRLRDLQDQNRGASSTGSSSASIPESLSQAVALSRAASKDAADLQKEAREDSRQLLASTLNGAKETFGRDSNVASTAGSSAAE
jgi:hypothetical protein